MFGFGKNDNEEISKILETVTSIFDKVNTSKEVEEPTFSNVDSGVAHLMSKFGPEVVSNVVSKFLNTSGDVKSTPKESKDVKVEVIKVKFKAKSLNKRVYAIIKKHQGTTSKKIIELMGSKYNTSSISTRNTIMRLSRNKYITSKATPVGGNKSRVWFTHDHVDSGKIYIDEVSNVEGLDYALNLKTKFSESVKQSLYKVGYLTTKQVKALLDGSDAFHLTGGYIDSLGGRHTVVATIKTVKFGENKFAYKVEPVVNAFMEVTSKDGRWNTYGKLPHSLVEDIGIKYLVGSTIEFKGSFEEHKEDRAFSMVSRISKKGLKIISVGTK